MLGALQIPSIGAHAGDEEQGRRQGSEGKDIENGGIYIIPFHSVGEDNGILYGIRLDEMVIERESEELHIKFPIVGIYEGELSANHKYKIILNSGVF